MEHRPYTRPCFHCRRSFTTPRSLKHVRHCSYACAWKTRKKEYKGRGNPYFGKHHTDAIKAKMRGPHHHKWKGGRHRHPEGYIYVLARTHPRANQAGYVYEHILVMETKLRRSLRPGEVVHHLNHVKDDNRPENLMTFRTNTEHLAHHRRKP